MARGNGGQRIFADDTDYRRFIRILTTIKKRQPFDLFAYCLMPNHFHLLLRVDRYSVSLIMQHLMTRYACWFNKRRKRIGHVFQGRFKALLCDTDSYLLVLLRYIHLNPVCAGLVTQPDQWEWSSHREYGEAPRRALADLEFPLSMFGGSRDVAVTRCRSYIEAQGSPRDMEAPPRPDGGQEIKRAHADVLRRDHEATLQRIAEAVCADARLSVADLLGSSRRRPLLNLRRSFILQSAANGLRPSEIAAFIHRHPSMISRLINAA